MRVVKEKAEAAVVSMRDLYRRLSPGQRVTLIAAAGLAAVLLGTTAVSGWRGDGGTGPVDSAATAGPVGGSASEEPRSRSGGLWDLVPPGGAWNDRQRDTHRKRLEQALTGVGNVREATVVLPPDSSSRRVLDPGSDPSATVKLTLEAGVPALARQEADALRDMVCCALNVRPERVCMVDQNGKSYPAPGSLLAEGRSIDEDERRREIRSLIDGYFSALLRRSEFYVAVAVFFSQEQITEEKEEYDSERTISKVIEDECERFVDQDEGPAGGVGPPPRQPNDKLLALKSKTKEQVFPSVKKTRKSVPRGTFQSASVTVLLDLDAVRAALERGADSGRALTSAEEDLRLEAYRIAHEDNLRLLLQPYRDASATVLIRPLVRSEPEAPSPPSVAVAPAAPSAPPPLPAASSGSSSWSWFLAGALGIALLAFVGALLRRVRPSRELAGDLAPARDPSADWGVRRNVDEARRIWSIRTGNVAARGRMQEGLLHLVEETSRRVRRRPEATAAVLRCWLAQDPEESAKGASDA